MLNRNCSITFFIFRIILLGNTYETLTGDNSIIWKGSEASFKTDIATFQEELMISISDDYLQKEGKRNDEDKFNKRGYDEIKTIIPSFTRKYQNKIEVIDDELVYIGLDEKERQWVEEARIINAPKLTINYIDEEGKKLIEPYIITVPNKKYSIKSPEIDGYKTVDDILEGEILEDKEINVEYYPQYYDLVFKGLNEKEEITDNEAEITSYMVGDGTTTAGNGVGKFSGKNLVVPDKYKGKMVTKNDKFAFNGNSTVETLILPNTIKSINDRCFQSCLKLKEVYIPSGIIGGLSFYGCNNLNKVILGINVTEIHAEAFYGCKDLESFVIRSEKIELYGYGNFLGCSKLKEIKINQDNKSYKVIDGVMYTIDGKKIVIYPTGKEDDEYIVPDTVEEICQSAFSYADNITKVKIQSSVKLVDQRASENCKNLQEVEIYSNSIKTQAFYNCGKLKDVKIGNNVTEISHSIFGNCSSLMKITYDGKMEEWNNINKSTGWKNGSNNLSEIECIDGIINL